MFFEELFVAIVVFSRVLVIYVVYIARDHVILDKVVQIGALLRLLVLVRWELLRAGPAHDVGEKRLAALNCHFYSEISFHLN